MTSHRTVLTVRPAASAITVPERKAVSGGFGSPPVPHPAAAGATRGNPWSAVNPGST